MYNNFSSKKTKKVISALLASALVVTSAPITANAATAKVLGVGKTFTVKKTTKVSGLSKAEKKIVKVTVNKKKRTVTVKGLKAGKATFKIGKKAYTVKVGATKIAKKTLKTTMTAGTSQTVSVTATAGKGDTIKFASSNKAVLTVNKTSAKASAKGIAKMGVKAVKEGTATLTVSSKNTGVKKAFKITVKAAAPAATNAPTVATTPGITTPTATVAATKAPSVATTPAVQTTAPAGTDAAPTQDPTATKDPNATQNPDGTQDPNATKDPSATDAVSTEVPATEAPVPTQTPDVTTGEAVTADAISVAKQTGRNTITVTGSALSDNVDDYTVTRGKSTLTVSEVTVSEDKTTADIKLASSSMSAGEYSVTFNDATCTLTAEAEVIDSIVIVGTSLVAEQGYDGSSKKNATIGYKVLNQFGERMADDGSDISIQATCTLDAGTTVTTPASRSADGVITVPVANGVIDTTVGSLVLVDTKSGKNANAVVKLSSSAKIASVKVVGVYNTSTGKATELQSGITNTNIANYGILLKAYDQYGNEYTTFDGETNSTPFKNVTVSISGNTGIDITAADWSTPVTVDDEDYICIPFALKNTTVPTTAGTSIVTIVGDQTGLLASVNLVVKDAVTVTDFTVKATDTLYYGSTTEMEYSATDSEGNVVTDYNTLNTDANIAAVLNSDYKWERQKDGSAKLYFTPSATTFDQVADQTKLTGRTKDSVNGTINTSIDANVHVSTIKVYAQKRCAKINGLTTTAPKAAVLGNTITYKLSDFVIEDQYGNTMLAAEVAADTDAEVRIKSDANTNAFDEDFTTDAYVAIDNSDPTILTATAANSKANAGSETITFSLTTVAGPHTAISNSEFTATIKSTDIENVTGFAVSDIATLYVDPTSTVSAPKATNSKNVPFKVTGKYGSLTVEIPNTSYNVNYNGDMLSYGAGKISVVGDGDLGTGITSTKASFEVAIKNNAGTALVKEVNISNIAPEVATVEKKSTAQLTVSSIAAATGTVRYSDIAGLLNVKDQYAGYEAGFTGAVVTPKVLFTNIPEEFTVTDNNSISATLTATTATSGKSYTATVTLTYPSGVTFTDTVVIPVGTGSVQTPLALTGTTSATTLVKTDATHYTGSVSASGSITSIAFNDATVVGDTYVVSHTSSLGGENDSAITFNGNTIDVTSSITAGTYTVTISPKDTTNYSGNVVITITIS